MGGLGGAVAEDALKDGAHRLHAAEDVAAADRLGGEADRQTAGTLDQAAGVDGQEVEVAVGEREVLVAECGAQLA
ncbi:hypothetical protein OV079_41990 [Nannocystis pusilla]|uniref:Uncharacterized protein n=1 Tax=Nannocystis pusilla TaxID=889268 RepID=A0A9X3EZ05_9BACT|nr:hypothetical protein [Nannocystis pusilla]MCY1012009.1 hypothetical protein [Nannocystis pusilla]